MLYYANKCTIYSITMQPFLLHITKKDSMALSFFVHIIETLFYFFFLKSRTV